MKTPANVPEFFAQIQLDIFALKKKMVDLDERLTFYEERTTENRLMIEDNRTDIDRLKKLEKLVGGCDQEK
jgi:hypothetical protein